MIDVLSCIHFSKRSFRVRGRCRHRAAGFLRIRSAFQKRKRLTSAPAPAMASIGIRNLLAWKPVAGPAAVAAMSVENPRAVLIPLTNTAAAHTAWTAAKPNDPTVRTRRASQNRKEEFLLSRRSSLSGVSVVSTVSLQEKKGSTSSGMQQLDRKLRNRASGSMAVETVPLCRS